MSRDATQSRGYALLLAVFTIALLAIVLLATARVQGDASPALRRLRAQTAHEIAVQNAVARVAFLALTEPIGPRSIVIGGPREPNLASAPTLMRGRSSQGRELRLDGRFYEAVPRAFLALQDEAGLLALNGDSETALQSLLTQAGVQARQSRRMAAALADFADQDDLVRAGGAELAAYRRLGLPGPANRALISKWQALSALGWADGLRSANSEVFWSNVTTESAGVGVNINTAPRAVLAAMLGDARAAAAILARREQGELRDADEVAGLTGVDTATAGAGFATQPGAAFRIVIAFGETAGAAREAHESELLLAGDGAERPFYWRGGRWGQAEDLHGSEPNAVERLPGSAALRSP